ncbi:MAG: DUF4340 domain-containing protein [Magnetococcales bacterium]|nr:DUF4340 domain-containing protein [Magnetococcales bacterium]
MSDTSSMAKGWKINLLLLLTLIVVAVVLWWLEYRDARHVQEEKASRAISTMTPKAVTRVQFWRPEAEKGKEGTTWTILPQGIGPDGRGEPNGHWQITAPEPIRTRDAAVNQLLGVLGESYDQKVADTVADSAQFGLDKPMAVLTVQDGGGHTLQLSVGQSAPASKKQYLQIGVDGPVVLLSAKAVGGLLQNLEDLRDKTLFANQVTPSIQRIIRERPNERMVLERGPDKPWQLVAPMVDLAAENRVEGWLNALMQANGSGFVALKAEEAFQTAKPDWTFVLETEKGGKETVRIQRKEANLLAWREGEPDAMVLDMYLAEELDRAAMELVALRPLGNHDAPVKLQVTHQDKTLTTAKKDGQWPKPVWAGVEEIVTRDAGRAVKPKSHGEAWLTIIAFQEKEQWVIPFWKEGETITLAPPNRPVELELSHYQAEAFMDTVKALFPSE